MMHAADTPPRNAVRDISSRLGGMLPMMAIILFGFALRLYRLDADGLWFDEIGQAAVGMGDVRTAVQGASLHNGAAPADYLLTWLALRVAHNDFAVRLPAVINGTLALALIYQLGRVLFGPATGTLSALLLAVAPLHLRYSQEARFYALFTCVSIATTLALVLAVQHSNWRRWSAYTLLLILALYSHYFVPLVVLMQGLIVVVLACFPAQFALPLMQPGKSATARWKTLAAFLASCLIAGLAFLPWFVLVVLQEQGMPRATPPVFSWSLAQSILAGLVLGPGAEHSRTLPFWLPWVYLGLAAVGSLAGLAARRTRTGALYATAMVLILPYLTDLMIHRINYFFAIKQVLFVLPALLLLASFGALSLVRLASRPIPAASWRFGTAAVLTVAIALVLTWPLRPAADLAYSGRRFDWAGDWRDALTFVNTNAAPEDVIFSPSIPRYYLYYYAPQRTGQMLRSENKSDASNLIAAHPTGWMVKADDEDLPSFPAGVGAIRIDFGSTLAIVYWYPERTGRSPLSIIERWKPPASAIALASLGKQFGASDAEERAAEYFALSEARAENDDALHEVLAAQADFWRQQKDRQKAIEGYQRIVERWPESYESWVRLGESLLFTDQVEAASAALQRAVQLKPDHFWAQLYLGQARQRQGGYADAASAFQAAISLQPENPLPYGLLGDALAQLDDDAGAAAAYEKSLELSPSGPQASKIRAKLAEIRKTNAK